MNKKILSGTVILLALTLSACSNVNGESNNPKENPPKVVESTEEKGAQKEVHGESNNPKENPPKVVESTEEKEAQKEVQPEIPKETSKEIQKEDNGGTIGQSEEVSSRESEKEVNTEPVSEDFVSDTDQRDDRTAGYTDKLPENDELTRTMLKKLSKFGVNLVEPGKEPTKINKDNLMVIRTADGPEYDGWVVRYGKNKIGLLVKYKETTGTSAVLFGDKKVSKKITKDEFGEFLKFSEEVIKNNAQ